MHEYVYNYLSLYEYVCKSMWVIEVFKCTLFPPNEEKFIQ